MWKLFIDDERFPANQQDFVIARSFVEVQQLVNELGMPEFISFDHDLGDNQPTGYDIAKWLIEQDLDGFAEFPADFEFYVHSMNPVGAENIRRLIANYLVWR